MAKGNSRDFFSSDFSLDHPVREGEDSFESFLRANRIIQEYVDYFIKANASYESFEIPVWKSCASGSGRKEITFSVMKKMILREIDSMNEKVLLGPIIDKYFVRGEKFKMEKFKMDIWEQMYERQGCFLR